MRDYDIRTAEEAEIGRLLSDIRTHRDEDRAFETLHSLFGRRIGQLLAIYRFRTEDTEACQQALLALHRAVMTYDPSHNTGFDTYACACIRHALADLRESRRRRERHTAGGDALPETAAGETDIEDDLADREQQRIFLDRARLILSDFQYRVLCLQLEGYSTADIASELSTTAKKVDNAKYRTSRNEKIRALFSE